MAVEKQEANELEKVFEFTSVSQIVHRTLTDLEYILEYLPRFGAHFDLLFLEHQEVLFHQ